MKIWYNTASAIHKHKSHRPYYDATVEHADAVLGTNVVTVHGTDRPEFELPISSVYFEFLAKSQLISNIIWAEQQGYDAAVIGCMGDPGLSELRPTVAIPVVGSRETSLLLARMLGRIGTVSYRPPRPIKYGWMDENAVVSRKGFNITPHEMLTSFKKPKPVIEMFKNAARETIKEGAEVVIPHCTILNMLLQKHKVYEVDGVPVFDPVGVALKVAEMWVELKEISGLDISRRYPPPPRELMDKLRKYHGGLQAHTPFKEKVH